MPSVEQINKIIESIKYHIGEASTLTIDDLIREKQLGQALNFKRGEGDFIKIIKIFNQIDEVDLSNIPFNFLNSFSSQIINTTNLLNQIIIFNPESSNPISQRDQLLIQIENQIEPLFNSALPILTISYIESKNLSQEKANLNSQIKELDEIKKKSREESSKLLSEIQTVLLNAQKAAGEIGIAKHSELFKTESDNHKKLSNIWLGTSFILVILIIGVSITFIYYFPSSGADTNFTIQYSITKLIVLSTIFIALSICTKNYKAHKHNQILNKHRQNALNTFETFANAAENDQAIKSAILLEVTRTIFSNQQTGYNDGGSEDSSNKVIEIVKNISSKE